MTQCHWDRERGGGGEGGGERREGGKGGRKRREEGRVIGKKRCGKRRAEGVGVGDSGLCRSVPEARLGTALVGSRRYCTLPSSLQQK